MKKCVFCLEEFSGKGNQKVCSKEHKTICSLCKKEFVFQKRYNTTFALKNWGNLFCSKKCVEEKKRRATIEAAKKITSHECVKCEEIFEGSPFKKICLQCESKKCKNCNTVLLKEDNFVCSDNCLQEYYTNRNKKIQETNRTRNNILGLANPAAREKAINTFKEKYGKENPFQSEEVKEKIKQTNLERYGVENISKLPETVKKIAQTKKERYGNENYNNNVKARETNISRYGVPAPNMNEELMLSYESKTAKKVSNKELEEFIDVWFKDKQRKITLEELQNHYSYASPVTLGKRIRDLNIQDKVAVRSSYLENIIKDILDKNNIAYKQHDRTVLKPHELDFYLYEYNVAIEVNDFLTHNSTWSPWGLPKDKNFHLNKTKACKDLNIRLIHAWENYLRNPRQLAILENIILHACGLTINKIYARKLRVIMKDPIALKEFFQKNNIAGYRGGDSAYALVDENNTVYMAYILGKPIFGRGGVKKYDAEIIRGASLLGYSVVGGASKLWKHIINNNSYETIVYYVDSNAYDGSSLNKIPSMEKISESISFKNYFVETKELKNRNPSKHKEIVDATSKGKIWTVYDAGTQTFVWKRPKLD